MKENSCSRSSVSFINARVAEQRKCTKNKLCILTNSSHVGTLSDLDNIFGREFDYCCHITPHCTIKQLILNIGNKLLSYNMKDHCIVMIWERDFRRTCNYAEPIRSIRESLQRITHTNIIFYTPVYVYGALIYNYKIELFDNLLYSDIQKYSYYFFDSNHYLSFDMFSHRTRKLNKDGIKNINVTLMDDVNFGILNKTHSSSATVSHNYNIIEYRLSVINIGA